MYKIVWFVVWLLSCAYSSARIDVLVFLTTECPIAARYAARINAIVQDYQIRGVQFSGFFPQAYETKEHVAEVIRARKHTFSWVLDKGGKVAREYGVTTVPTVVVKDELGRVVFFGGLDDHRDEPRVKRHYLREVLDALLSGKTPPISETLVFGCTIQFEESPPRAGTVTYAEHIFPVLKKSCLSCHSSGGAAPFSLVGYERARRWYRMMLQTTELGVMPPWGPVTEQTPTPHRIAPGFPQLLRQWNEAGFPTGSNDVSWVPTSSRRDWSLGTPTLILDLPKARIKANSGDHLTIHRLTSTLRHPVFLNGFEVLGANSRTTRRVSVYRSYTGHSSEGEWTDPPMDMSGWLGSWCPSEAPLRLRGGAGFWLHPGEDIVVVWHQRGAEADFVDSAQVGVFQGSPVAARELIPVTVQGPAFTLLPDEDMKSIRWTYETPENWNLVAARPLMRYFGKTMVVTADLPDGRAVTLCSALRWNYEWQATIFHEPAVFLPKGTKIHVSSLQSNRAGILDNPDREPITARTGPKRNDPQCSVLLGVVRMNALEAAISN